MDKKVIKIVCEIDKKDTDRIFLTTYNKYDECIETFKHDFRMNDEDDLCCKMQQKVEIKTNSVYNMCSRIKDLSDSIVIGVPLIYFVEV